MRFKKIFIEEEVYQDLHVKNILKNIPQASDKIRVIEKVDDVFQKVKKPYLQKRDNLNLFLGKKRGEKVKVAPSAYGKKGDPHYYFINSYNCPYECQYCYLQGYFHSADIVHFVNYQEIILEMEEKLKKHPHEERIWFHAGEFSDSLALGHLTNEWQYYFSFFEKNPQAVMELRTKSANIEPLLNLKIPSNIIVSYSLSPNTQSTEYDLRTASLKARMRSMERLKNAGYSLGVHFDPIVYQEGFEEEFSSLVEELFDKVKADEIEYFSLGVVRFTKEVFRQAKLNYPDSKLWMSELKKSFDGKVRYSRPLRFYIFKTIEELLIKKGVAKERIYYCMENDD